MPFLHICDDRELGTNLDGGRQTLSAVPEHILSVQTQRAPKLPLLCRDAASAKRIQTSQSVMFPKNLQQYWSKYFFFGDVISRSSGLYFVLQYTLMDPGCSCDIRCDKKKWDRKGSEKTMLWWKCGHRGDQCLGSGPELVLMPDIWQRQRANGLKPLSEKTP